MSGLNRLKMICDKATLIRRYCEDGKQQSALAGMGDITEPLTAVLSELMALKSMQKSFRFDEMSLLGGLQVALSSMQSGDLKGLATALGELIVPELEQALSQINPEQVTDDAARKWAEALDVRGSDQVICMFGYGDGACYSALRLRAAETATFIVFEPETDSILDLREQLQQHVDYYRLESLLVCAHPGYEAIFATEYVSFVHAINENRERVLVNKNTMSRFKDTASRNVIKNLHMLRNCNLVSDLADILPREIPVIVVSAGPSLDKNIELLKQAKGHCLIFAVDTAMKYLMQHDIMPDLGITVEPIKPMANYADDRIFDVPHIFDCESNPDIVSRERGRRFIYNCRDYMKNLYTAMGKNVPQDVASGGSVATAAFALCYELQMKTIILIGQDLAYEGTATHAGGVESAGINGDIGYEMVDGVDGNPVRTRSDWMGYLRWFENSIRTINEQKLDMTVVDATEGGALIHGSRVMTLMQALEKYCLGQCDYDFEKALKSMPCSFTDKDYEKLGTLIRNSFVELKAVRKEAHKAAALCDAEIAKLEDSSSSAVAMTTLSQARRKCEAALLYPLINNYAVSDIIEEVSRIRQSGDPAGEFKQQKLAFEAIAAACDYFEPMQAEAGALFIK